jgi:hypothetical protein
LNGDEVGGYALINYRYAAAFNGVGMNGTCGLGIDEADSNVQSRTALISEASLGIAKAVVRCNKSIHSSDYFISKSGWSAGLGRNRCVSLVSTFGAVSSRRHAMVFVVVHLKS